MDFWTNPVFLTALVLLLLLGLAEALRQVIPGLKWLGIPACILAGLLGLSLSPDLLLGLVLEEGAELALLDVDVLENVVYHALAVLFIAMGLQPSKKKPDGSSPVAPGVKAYSFGVPIMQSLQIVIGFGLVLVLSLFIIDGVHPGVGALLSLGFEQGPGQALAMGEVWEDTRGLDDGGQIGLIMASMGYAWSIVVGVPLVLWGRWRRLAKAEYRYAVIGKPREEKGSEALQTPGSLAPFTVQVAVIALVYLLTWGVCAGIYAITGMGEVWGFHFIVGTGIAMGVRPLLGRLPTGDPLDQPILSRVSAFTVDIMTAAALSAVQIKVLQANLTPILVITGVGGVLTLLACLWLASRFFPEAPFEHAVVWFGMSTGTLAMGLALLRIIDPDMRSPAPLAAVFGSAGAAAFSIPPLLLLLPAVMHWHHQGHAWAIWVGLGLALAYGLLLLIILRLITRQRFRRPWHRLWVRVNKTNKEAA